MRTSKKLLFYVIFLLFIESYFIKSVKAELPEGMNISLSGTWTYFTRETDLLFFDRNYWDSSKGYGINLNAGRDFNNFEVNLGIGYRVENIKLNQTLIQGNIGKIGQINYINKMIPILINGLYYFDFKAIKPFLGIGIGTTRVNLEFESKGGDNPVKLTGIVKKFKITMSGEIGVLFNLSDSFSIGLAAESSFVNTIRKEDLDPKYINGLYNVDEKKYMEINTGEMAIKILAKIVL